MKRILFSSLAIVACLLTISGPASAQKLHALIVTDQTKWAQWGKNLPHIQMDSLAWYVMLHENVPARQLEYASYAMEFDKEASPDGVLKLFDQFQPESNDTLLFYFSGHGKSDDRGHYFSLAGGKLYRQDVWKKMEQMGARLNVIISDCCNVRDDGKAFFAPMPMVDEPRTVTPIFRSLLFEPSGRVDISGSSPGEGAYFTPNWRETDAFPGSLFTKALGSYIKHRQNARVSWDTLLRDVSMRVHLDFRRGYPRGAVVSKGDRRRQYDQTVHAIDYPGMPPHRGPRTGIMIRDAGGAGAEIMQVRAGYPGQQVYDIQSRRKSSLRVQQTITAANGRAVRGAKDFVEAVIGSPQLMRLKVREQNGEVREYLMRLRY